MNLAILFGTIFAAYATGSVPSGLIISRRLSNIDIREKGSGNIGATNVKRTLGIFPGLLTLFFDLAKGAVPIYITLNMEITKTGLIPEETFISLIALSAFFGHLYPIYLKFRGGGKGVATAAGSFLVISPIACFIALSVFIVLTILTNRVSIGSLSGAATLPVAVWFLSGQILFAICAAVILIFIVIRHKENIIRLRAGTEPPFIKKGKQ